MKIIPAQIRKVAEKSTEARFAGLGEKVAKYRDNLPQMNGKLFLSDGGMGTTLIFHKGLDVPFFCAFPLLDDPSTYAILLEYFREYAAIGREQGTGFILDSGPTWRASTDWGGKLGYSAEELDSVNRLGIDMMCEVRDEYETAALPIVISGCMGPRGDGYEPGERMSPDEARDYHRAQVETFATTRADFVTAMTLTYSEEAAGIVLDNDATGAQTEAHQVRMMGEIALLTAGSDGRLDEAAYQRTVDTLLAGGSDPVITAEPEGAFTHVITDMALGN